MTFLWFVFLCYNKKGKNENEKRQKRKKNTFHLHSMEFLGQACRVASKHGNQWKNNRIIVLGQSSREWNHSGINPCLFHPFYTCFYSSITLDFPKDSTENMTGYQRVCYKISDLLTCVSLSGSTLRLRWRYIRIIWRVARGGGVNVKAGLRTVTLQGFWLTGADRKCGNKWNAVTSAALWKAQGGGGRKQPQLWRIYVRLEFKGTDS